MERSGDTNLAVDGLRASEKNTEEPQVNRVVAPSVARQLALAILAASGGILLLGGGAVVAMGGDPGPLIIVLGASAICLAGATWFASRRLVSHPVLDLAGGVRELALAEDHAYRFAKPSNEELGLLVDNLNALLGEIEQRGQLLLEQHLKEGEQRLQEKDQGLQERDQRLREQEQRFKALESEVAARTGELHESTELLEVAKTQAAAADQSKSQCMANVAHEIRTPMTGVFGMAEILLSTDLTPQQQKYARAVQHSAEDLLAIVSDILDFSKVEAGRFDRIDHQPFSPRVSVKKVLELQSVVAQQRGLTVSHECTDDMPHTMLGDGKRLRQVLTNIIGNAIKHTERGSIVVRSSVVERHANECAIRFEVCDTGTGIPSYLHKDIFDGFSQADTSTTRQCGGTGLGLAIAKHLVTLMGGQIGVVSKPGVGSNFWFTIQGELYVPAAADLDLGGARALVVAGDRASGEALRDQLVACGGDGAVVPDRESALAALEAGDQRAVSLVLIDTQRIDVPALVHDIRADEASTSLPLVLVSTVTYGEASLKRQGVDGALTKPVSREELWACVDRLTGGLAVSVPLETQDAQPVVGGTGVSARVLVAEDHRVNQEVATTMFEILGCEVDVVANGQQAVEAVQRCAYDIVFLDCEMPQLDGYQATQKIRQLEQQNAVETDGRQQPARRLPVVALTAHLSPADQAQGLESGMDDYVSKPFSLQTLHGVLGRWLGEHRLESVAPPVSPPSVSRARNATDEGPISERVLERTLELDRIKDGGVFARVVSAFLAEAPATLADLRTAAREGDARGMVRSAHALRSASLNVGAESMATLCKEVESLGKSGKAADAAVSATRIDELYPAVKTSLEERLERDRHDDVVSV